MLCMLGVVPLPAVWASPLPALPRIAVREGRFVQMPTRRAFVPRGFNYIRLRKVGQGSGGYLWHDTLNPASYSKERTEAMFADLQRRGFNLVRIFLDPMPGAGFVEYNGAPELSPRYLANLMDFLERARAHGVYVLLCFCYVPDRTSYRAGPPPEHVAGANQQYLHPGVVAAKARWMADVASAIRDHDRSLLSTVFAYELDNESHFVATAPPFALTEGIIRWGGKEYDASRPDDLQRLADDAIVQAIDAAARAVRAVDPQALVGASVFTFHAVGRSGPGRLRSDRTQDARFPARALAIAKSKAAYVDVHFYPMTESTLDADYASIEWPSLRETCKKAGKPLLVGEIGAFKHAYPDLGTAAEAMNRTLSRLQADGWAGFLYWTYDNLEQSDALWEATANNGLILRTLERAFKR